jgi:beta-lactamase regulating signal transducer with metallopeptidase domain
MIEPLGWALVHFLWQGAAIALLLALARRLLRHASANARYLAACAALLLMLVAPLATFLSLERPAPASAVIAAASPLSPLSLSVAPLASPPGPPPAQTPWLALVVAAWAVGVALLSVRMAGGLLLTRRLERRATPVTDREWRQRLDRLATRIGLRRAVRLCESALAEVPMAAGWLRPLVLLPAGALLRLPPEQVEAVLAHELAHIRRYDYLINLFQTAVETLLFYHPAVWWVGRRIREERELCCDDIAVAATGDAIVYARALVELETLSRRAPQMALAATGGSLLHRVKRLLGAPSRPRRHPGFGLAGLLGMLALVAAWACAQPLIQNPSVLHAQAHDLEIKMHAASLMPPARAIDAQPTPAQEATDTPRAPMLSIVNPTPRTAANSAASPQKPSTSPALAPAQQQPSQKTQPEQTGSYSQAIAAAGYPNLSVDQLIEFKMQGITPDYIRRLRAAGFQPSAKEIVAMKIMGVTPEYAAQMKAAGYPDLAIRDLIAARAQGIDPEAAKKLNALGFGHLSIHQLISARIFGVDAESVRTLKAAGFPDLQFHDLIAARVQGLTPAYVAELKQAGFPNLQFHDVIAARVQGITPAYVAGLKQAGFSNLQFRDVIAARVQGLTPAYVAGLKQAGFPNLQFHDVIAARVQGLTPAYVASLKQAGFPNLQFHDVIAARVQGITPAYVAGLKQAGFSNLQFHDVIAARVQGLTPEYVRGLREAGFPNLTFEQALRARVMGVTPDFAREARAHGFKDLTLDKLIRLKMLGVLPDNKQ